MANFNTHLVAASAGSGFLATGLLGSGISSPDEALMYLTAGAFGGLLPDVDSDNSIILEVMFNLLTVLLTFMLIFFMSDRFGSSILELLLMGTISHLFFHFIVFTYFKKLTIHRGLFHSIPSGALSGLFATILVFHMFNQSPRVSWTCGFFIFVGYLIHLLLDEVYSVDLMGKELKMSFGTALKFFDGKNVPITVMIYLVIFIIYWFTPDVTPFLDSIFTGEAVSRFQANFLPFRHSRVPY